MQKERGGRIIAIVALVVAVVGVSIGYASLTRELEISGAATVDPLGWDIHFANLSSVALTGEAAETTAPTINTEDTHISAFGVTLKQPGDKAVYTFDIVNAGGIDAVITSLVNGTPTINGTGAAAAEDVALVTPKFTYTLTYTTTGEAVAEDDVLGGGETVNVTLTVGYDIGKTLETTPAGDVTITGLSTTIIYGQYEPPVVP